MCTRIHMYFYAGLQSVQYCSDVHISACTNVNIYTDANVYMYAQEQIRYTQMNFERINVCMYMYVCIYAHTYT